MIWPRFAALAFGAVATASATVDSLLVDSSDFPWLALSVTSCLIGLIVACAWTRLSIGSRALTVGIGTFGLFLVAQGTGLLLALFLVDSNFADWLRQSFLATAPGRLRYGDDDNVYYAAMLFGAPTIVLGLMCLLPTRRVWDAEQNESPGDEGSSKREVTRPVPPSG